MTQSNALAVSLKTLTEYRNELVVAEFGQDLYDGYQANKTKLEGNDYRLSREDRSRYKLIQDWMERTRILE